MKTILLIGAGGFIGSIARYLISRSIQLPSLTSFPLGTLTVNVIGSLLIGLLFGFSERGTLVDPQIRLFLVVGICGGFTTFSAFSAEGFYLLRNGQFYLYLIYALASVALSLLAVYLGYFVSKSI
jgi:fluoride exporter